MNHKDRMAAVAQILESHRGAHNAITAKKISKCLNLPSEDTQSVTRKLIHAAANLYDLPVVATTNGYYLAVSQDDIDAYNKLMDNRMNGILKTKLNVNVAFAKYTKRMQEIFKNES